MPVPVMVGLPVIVHVLVPPMDHVPEPIAMVRVLELLLEKPPAAPDKETLYEEASNVPFVSVKTVDTDWLNVKASCNVTDPPGVLMVNVCVNVLPALVIV